MDGNYIAGFVDGEGSFRVAISKRADLMFGWQVIPEFHISQNSTSKSVLEDVRNTLQCGYIKSNHALSKSDRTLVYVVRNRRDLTHKVVPFFKRFPLHTAKRHDFQIFSEILTMLNKHEHLTRKGFEIIIRKAYSMNASGKYRRYSAESIQKQLSSSETIR